MAHVMRKALVEAKLGYDSLVGRGVAFQHQPLGRHIDPGGLAGYYCDFRHKAKDASRYSDGIPRDGSGHRLEWPIPVAQAALGYWELLLEGQDVEGPFLALANWLVEHATPAAGGLVWRCNVAVPKYGLSPGWPSAMAQSEGISVLLRAEALSGREHYRDVARAGLAPLLMPVSAGGVARELDGQLVLEEYPAAAPAAVLNGWIVALLGVHELATATGDERARTLFARSLSSLMTLLPRYDIGWWSLYSLYDHGLPDLAKPFYQRLHPVLLDALRLVRPDRRLAGMARRWEAQITSLGLLRVAVNKGVFRIWRSLDRRRG
jgi:heparosan-N-sulfate-glucuronate 5-epimerase